MHARGINQDMLQRAEFGSKTPVKLKERSTQWKKMNNG
jgi:hypothetical protein